MHTVIISALFPLISNKRRETVHLQNPKNVKIQSVSKRTHFFRIHPVLERFRFQTYTCTDTCTCSFRHTFTFLYKKGFDFKCVWVCILVGFNPLSASYP